MFKQLSDSGKSDSACNSELAKASIFFVEIEASFIFMDCVIVKPKIHMQRMNIVIIFCFICRFMC